MGTLVSSYYWNNICYSNNRINELRENLFPFLLQHIFGFPISSVFGFLIIFLCPVFSDSLTIF